MCGSPGRGSHGAAAAAQDAIAEAATRVAAMVGGAGAAAAPAAALPMGSPAVEVAGSMSAVAGRTPMATSTRSSLRFRIGFLWRR